MYGFIARLDKYKQNPETSPFYNMPTIISDGSSAVGCFTCLHEFHEARKAAYFKPSTALFDMFILVSSRYIYWGKPQFGILSYWLRQRP